MTRRWWGIYSSSPILILYFLVLKGVCDCICLFSEKLVIPPKKKSKLIKLNPVYVGSKNPPPHVERGPPGGQFACNI